MFISKTIICIIGFVLIICAVIISYVMHLYFNAERKLAIKYDDSEIYERIDKN